MTNSNPIQLKRLLWVGPLTVLASVIGVLIVRILAVAILHPNPNLPSMGWIAPIIFTVVLCTGAVLVFALVAHFSKDPIRTYQIIAFIVLLLSFLPDIGFARSSFPGATWAVAIALMIMHIVAWAITVTMLEKLTTSGSN